MIKAPHSLLQSLMHKHGDSLSIKAESLAGHNDHGLSLPLILGRGRLVHLILQGQTRRKQC